MLQSCLYYDNIVNVNNRHNKHNIHIRHTIQRGNNEKRNVTDTEPEPYRAEGN